MARAADVRRIALSLAGTVEGPHFDRTAFKVARIYATLAADGKTLNAKLTPDEEELKCHVAPDMFSPVPNAWVGRAGRRCSWHGASEDDLRAALEMAWCHARPRKRKPTNG